MHAEKLGKGKRVLVFLHGWGGMWQSWFPLIERLKTKFKIYALDLPGFGQSSIERPYSLHDYAHDVIDCIAQEKIKKPVLIGHSLGGAIALKIALEKPEIASGLVLIGAAGVRPELDMKKRIIMSIAKTGRTVLSLPGINRLREPIRKTFYKKLGLLDAGYYDAKNETLKKTFSKLCREDLSNEFQNIHTPTLILWGERDSATLLKSGKKTHEGVKGSQMITFPNAGHFVYLEETDKCAEAIAHFVSSIK